MIFDAHCDIWTETLHITIWPGKEISSADIITNG